MGASVEPANAFFLFLPRHGQLTSAFPKAETNAYRKTVFIFQGVPRVKCARFNLSFFCEMIFVTERQDKLEEMKQCDEGLGGNTRLPAIAKIVSWLEHSRANKRMKLFTA